MLSRLVPSCGQRTKMFSSKSSPASFSKRKRRGHNAPIDQESSTEGSLSDYPPVPDNSFDASTATLGDGSCSFSYFAPNGAKPRIQQSSTSPLYHLQPQMAKTSQRSFRLPPFSKMSVDTVVNGHTLPSPTPSSSSQDCVDMDNVSICESSLSQSPLKTVDDSSRVSVPDPRHTFAADEDDDGGELSQYYVKLLYDVVESVHETFAEFYESLGILDEATKEVDGAIASRKAKSQFIDAEILRLIASNTKEP